MKTRTAHRGLLAAAGVALLAAAPNSYSATTVPAAIPATAFEGGGEGRGYHDATVGNQGNASYRASEDVDIFRPDDPSAPSAYIVKNFEAGEWLAYTINVPATGYYNVDIRAATNYDFPSSAYHLEVDGNDLTGSVVLPNTGGWTKYAWLGKKTIHLTAGTRLLKVVADRHYFGLQTLRVTAVPSSTPYWQTPAAVPGTIEAEDFDRGGQGVGYDDNVAGNAGGQYRTGESVDIFPSDDSAGGSYVVKHFERGEWLAYTINAAATGDYDIELRAATNSDFPNSAYHVELDGRDVTGGVVLPDTRGWGNYQWLGKKRVRLTAGQHVLKLFSDQPYFGLDSIRVSAATTPPPPSSGATPLFKSGFEGTTVLGPLVMYSTGAWQDVLGLDSETGFAWPPKLWGGTSSRFQLIAGDSEQVTAITLPGYTYNELQSVTGHDGTATRALFSTVQKSVGGALVNFDSTQNDFGIFPGAAGQGDLYLSYWLKFQPDLLQRMTVNSWAGRVVTDWKTGGDYRLILSVYGDRAGNRLYWNARGDNLANGGLPQQIFWEQNNFAVPVPVGQWFRVEAFVHRSGGSDGRVWLAVNGQTIVNRYGSNMGVNNLPWNRIFAFLNYSSGQSLPAYQWVDDLEVWDGFPSTASPH